MENFQNLHRAAGLGADPENIHPERREVRYLLQYLVGQRRLCLDAVEHQEILFLPGLEEPAVRIVDALELAVVLGQVE